MSVLKSKHPQYQELAFTRIDKPKLLMPGGSLDSAESFCAKHGFGQTEAESSEALACCPAPVRAAIAMHYLWDQLIRSNWRSVQLLAFAYLKAAHGPTPALAATSGYGVNPTNTTNTSWTIGRIQPNWGTQSSFANRLLHALAVLHDNKQIRAVNADQIDYKTCRDNERCGNQNLPGVYRSEQDDHMGFWTQMSEDNWRENKGHRLKRAPRSLVLEFYRRIAPLFQPYLHDAFDWSINEDVVDLYVRVEKRRSHVNRKVVTLGLCHAMEEVVDVLPAAVNHCVGHSYPRHWKRDTVEEIGRYRVAREEFAFQCLASRHGDMNGALRWYDVQAEAAYLTPQVKPREVGSYSLLTDTRISGGSGVRVPGLDRTRLESSATVATK